MTLRHRRASIRGLEALAHPARLAVAGIVAAAGRRGIASGDVARRAGLAPGPASHHLGLLADAGLVLAERAGRSVVYRVDPDAVAGLVRDLRRALGLAAFDPILSGPATAQVPQDAHPAWLRTIRTARPAGPTWGPRLSARPVRRSA